MQRCGVTVSRQECPRGSVAAGMRCPLVGITVPNTGTGSHGAKAKRAVIYVSRLVCIPKESAVRSVALWLKQIREFKRVPCAGLVLVRFFSFEFAF